MSETFIDREEQMRNSDRRQTRRIPSEIPIALAADERYRPGLEVTRASMERSCSDVGRLKFHVFRETPEWETRIRREFGTYKGSVMAFLRLYLPELLPDADWVVYADVDTIWNRDVCELWELRDETKTVQWVRDMWSTRRETAVWQKRIDAGFDTEKYGCSGVMLLNLKRMRETNLLARAIEFTNRHGLFKYVDQDILNALCNRDCGMLPVCWDVLGCWKELPADSRCVYHVTGIGRHFGAKRSPVYPPQYQLWWNARTGERAVHGRSRLLARLWPLRGLLSVLPNALRERVVRQMYFARELVRVLQDEDQCVPRRSIPPHRIDAFTAAVML